MATYKQIFGKAIKFLATDPSAGGLGQIWYNTVSNTYKTVLKPAAWSSAPTLNIARDNFGSARHGTNTAGLCYGGHTSGPTDPEGDRDVCESYNGSAWTSVNVLNSGVTGNGGAGTQAAALSFAGQTAVTQTESWDGTNWTTVNSMNTGRSLAGQGSAGTQGAALAMGGGPPGFLTATEEFDGTNWATSPGSMNTARSDLAGTSTESYDGSTWTSQGALNTARRRAAGGGTLTAGLAFGGLVPGPAATTSTETFDGSSWTAASSMGTGRYFLSGFGLTSTQSMAMGGLLTGSASNYTNLTEEYVQAEAVKTLTTS